MSNTQKVNPKNTAENIASAVVVADALSKLLRGVDIGGAYSDLAMVVSLAIDAGHVEQCRRTELRVSLDAREVRS